MTKVSLSRMLNLISTGVFRGAAIFCVTAVTIMLAPFSFAARQLADRPGAPTNLILAIRHNIVTLSWTPSTTGGVATHFLIKAGSATGAVDYGIYNVGLVTSVTAAVPPGAYFVRVVGVNVAGEGPASHEMGFSIGAVPVSSLRCIAFGPYVASYSPRTGNHPPPSVLETLVDRVVAGTGANCLMTFGVLGGLDYAFEIARRRALKVIAILWLEGDAATDDQSINQGILRARQYPDTIVRVACGSELRRSHGAALAERLIGDCFTRLKSAGVSQPVGTNDTWWALCHEQWPCSPWPFAAALDWVGANVYAWWENKVAGLFPCIPASDAPAFHVARFLDVRTAYSNKEVILTEFGWPAGPDGYREINQRTAAPGCGIASEANQQDVVNQTVAHLRQQNLPHVVFSAFREPWKVVEGPVGPWWGILADTFTTESADNSVGPPVQP
jgi:exo-beta-1,3-glucanase (GH17 family)